MNMKEKIKDKFITVLCNLNEGRELDFRDMLIISMFSTKNPNLLTNKQLIDLVTGILNCMESNDNCIWLSCKDIKASVIGDMSSVNLISGIGIVKGHIIHNIDYLLIPEITLQRGSVLQMLMSSPDEYIISAMHSLQGGNEDRQNIENMGELISLTEKGNGDGEFILLINNDAIVIYKDPEGEDVLVKKVSLVDRTVSESDLSILSLYVRS